MVDARKPAAAGVFYPAEREALQQRVRALLQGAVEPPPGKAGIVRAIVAPHRIEGPAGAAAAVAWAHAGAWAGTVGRVLLLGPSHHVPFAGVAAPFADAFTSPLGAVPVDRLAIEAARRHPQLVVSDLPHEQEPSLEVQLPFLQTVFPDVPIVPLVVGEVTEEEAAAVIEDLWTEHTLVVVSTDLSHYFDAVTAARIDEETARSIESLQAENLGPDQACGHAALRALLLVAQRRRLRVARLALRGADAGGSADRDEVIGFGAFAVRVS